MTNEEKANEICKRHIFDSNLYNGCMEMAEWKDEEFAKERRETDVKEWLIEHGLEWELEDILDLI